MTESFSQNDETFYWFSRKICYILCRTRKENPVLYAETRISKDQLKWENITNFITSETKIQIGQTKI
jgi:hypothetical protein